MGLGQMISGLIIGFVFKWDLALVTLATSAITFVPAAVYTMSSLDRRTKMLAAAYGEAGGVASETLSGLRTVVSLGLEPASPNPNPNPNANPNPNPNPNPSPSPKAGSSPPRSRGTSAACAGPSARS